MSSLLPKGKCLVLMPFASQFREVYDQVYRPVCDDNGLECWRVDELNSPGSITRDIVGGIMEASIIIADLTTRNPNVFYELGIAHSNGNKTIMVAQSIKDVPFDIANYRVLVYEQSISGAKKFYAQIDSSIKGLLKSLEQTNNPVQEVMSEKLTMHLGRKRLLMEEVRIDWLKKPVREIIEKEKILYMEDFARLDLEKLRTQYGIGPVIMAQIAGIQLRSKIGTNPEMIQKIALKYRFSPDIQDSVFI